MTRRMGSALFVFILLLVAACSKGPGEKKSRHPSEVVVAEVNGEKVSMEDLKREILEVRGFSATLDVKEATRGEIMKALQRLIQEAIIIREGKERGITVTDSDLREAVRKIRKDYPEGKFESFLAKEGIDEKVWEEKLRRTLLLEKISEAVKKETPPVTYQEIKDYMRKNHVYIGRKVWQPKKWHLREYVFYTEEEARRARDLISALDGKHDEEVLEASRIKVTIYDLGFLTEKELGKGYFKEIKHLKEGEVSDVVKLPSSYALFRVLKITPKRVISRAQALKELEGKIYRWKQERYFSRWLRRKFNESSIRVNEAALWSLEEAPGEKK
ncbi:MAG: hypothetical protein D6713_05110 [Deltaproteobacteria bacterium]|nr:MAG: hypothetical protein D6713_05110 [Deltaproteobacteria bacterium]